MLKNYLVKGILCFGCIQGFALHGSMQGIKSLKDALYDGDIQTVATYINENSNLPDLSDVTINGRSLLMTAVYATTPQPELVEWLIMRGAEFAPIEGVGHEAYGALREAMKNAWGLKAAIENYPDNPFFAKIFNEQTQELVKVMKLLLDHKKVAVNQKDRFGKIPLEYALEKDIESFVQLLLDYGADPSINNAFKLARSAEMRELIQSYMKKREQ